MLPQSVILTVFSLLAAQGNVVYALPAAPPLHNTYSEGIYGRYPPKSLDTREPIKTTGDSIVISARGNAVDQTFDLERRVIPDGVSVLSTITTCVLAHKVLGGMFAYYNCPASGKLKDSASALKTSARAAGHKVIEFTSRQTITDREAALIAAAPTNVVADLKKDIKEFANQLLIASFIIMDVANSAHLRTGAGHAVPQPDAAGTPAGSQAGSPPGSPIHAPAVPVAAVQAHPAHAASAPDLSHAGPSNPAPPRTPSPNGKAKSTKN